MSDDCEHCRRALRSPPFTAGLYDDACDGCVARSIARSLVMFKAVRHAEAGELRDAISRLLPKLDVHAARRIVWDWWRHDHPADAVATSASAETRTPAVARGRSCLVGE